jgi:hypothetical protein
MEISRILVKLKKVKLKPWLSQSLALGKDHGVPRKHRPNSPPAERTHVE